MQKVSFGNSNREFTIALKQQVDAYFKSNKIKQTGNSKLYVKTAVLFGTLFLLYGFLVFAPLPAWLGLILSGLLGLTFAGIGFNVMHDGGHGSYSGKRWVNQIMAYSLNFLGGNSFFWKAKHNNNHHGFTNIEGLDEDIDIRPFIRTGDTQKRSWYHKFQHIYWVPLYSLLYFAWVFLSDFRKYITRKVADTRIKKMSRKEHFVFWGSKVMYLVIFIVLPVVFQGWTRALIGYGVAGLICGFTIALVFQLAHVIEGTSMHVTSEEKATKLEDWTVHQLATTANFSTKSKLITWYAGGLNFQVEHHLFPGISHVHYPELSKVVKGVCEQFNIKYMEYSTMFSAVRSHVKYLKMLGTAK